MAGLPEMFKPLLWGLRFESLDIKKDQEDIIVNAINEVTLAHWRWIIKTYGKEEIRQVLARRPETEFRPESLNLAKLVFSLPPSRHSRSS